MRNLKNLFFHDQAFGLTVPPLFFLEILQFLEVTNNKTTLYTVLFRQNKPE
jgi:hypothetical protein